MIIRIEWRATVVASDVASDVLFLQAEKVEMTFSLLLCMVGYCSEKMMVKMFSILCVCVFPGIHHRYVLSTNVARREAQIRRSHWNPAVEQPHGRQDLDTGHLLPKFQKINFPQHDHTEQAFSHYAKRDCALYNEVMKTVCIYDEWAISFWQCRNYFSSTCCYRLTISSECPMNLMDFPMDGHTCPLRFGSCE